MTDTQRRVASVWAQVLNLPHVDPHAHFLDLGGQSLKAMQIISRLQEVFGIELPGAEVFQCPTVVQLAALIDSLGPQVSPATPPALHDVATQAERRVHRYFERQAAATPEAHAVRCGKALLTYRDLNHRANVLAHALIRLGVTTDVPVALFIDRSESLAVVVLAILKAGGAYVPLDRSYPRERLAWMLEDSQVPIILSERKCIAELPAHAARTICVDELSWDLLEEALDPPVDDAVDPLAYVIYTSGSTGRPKGVAMSHRPLANLVHWQMSVMPLAAGAPVVQFAPISFDVSFQEMFSTWAQGGCLHFISDDTRVDPRLLGRYVEDHSVERLFLPFVALRQFAESTIDLPMRSLKRIITAGEQLVITESVRAFFTAHPGCRLHNHYGPTETHVVTSHDLPDDPRRWPVHPPIGRAIWNTRILLLDEDRLPVSQGQPGELYVGGAALARGYLGQPDLTSERFVFDPDSGERLYRTGDLARLNTAGELEFLGRADDQVKFRGYRIELGEIEAVLGRNPMVRQAVVVLHEDVARVRRLVAYVLASAGADPDAVVAESRQLVARQLPEYMAPQAYVVLDTLPTTPSGKVDRRALPPPSPGEFDRDELTGQRTVTPTEAALVEIWTEALGTSRIRPTDNLFDLGGNSLLVARMAWMIRKAFGVEVPVRKIFEHPTIVALAQLVDSSEVQPKAEQPPATGTMTSNLVVPMSYAQQRLWFLNRFEVNPAVYNICLEIRLQGPLELRHLQSAIDQVVQRHQPLRTTFDISDGEPVQRIELRKAIPLQVDDLRTLTGALRTQQLQDIERIESRWPFDLRTGPLLRARVIRMTDEDCVLILGMHHIVSDGWSMGLLLEEISECYRAACRGTPPDLPPLPMHYAQFAEMQRTWLQTGLMKPQIEYWRNHLAGAPESLEIATDHSRPTERTAAGDCRELTWPRELVQKIEAAARQRGLTLYMALLAVYAEFLHRYSGQDHAVIGSPFANRTRPEIEHLIGFFVNSLPLHVDLSGDPTVDELLERVRQVALGAYSHQDVPFEKLVEELRPRRSLNRSPLFQAMLVLQNTPQLQLDMPGLQARMRYLPSGTAKMDLLLSVEASGDELTCNLEYSTELFDPPTIDRMQENMRSLAMELFSDPQRRLSQVPMGHDAERQLTVESWNRTERPYPRDGTIHQVFERVCVEHPESIALSSGECRWSYRQLNEYANRLAHRLVQEGVEPGSPVAISIERSPELIGGLLAILKTGGCYVPLDSDYPAERLRFMLSDSAASIVVTTAAMAASFAGMAPRVVCIDSDSAAIECCSASNPAVRASSMDPAYVVYTSGSTGTPKGVAVPHRAVLRLVFGCDYARFAPDRVFLHLAPISFDASTFELWGSLLHGAHCVIAPPGLPSLQQIGRIIEEQQVTTAWLTSALFNTVIDQQPQILAPLSELLIGGEALSVAHVRRALSRLPRTQLINGYGPTESTTFACCYRIPRELDPQLASIPIGVPIGNTRVYILDDHYRPVPIGTHGQLLIGGDGLALGYLNNPQLTAEKFIDLALGGSAPQRLYCTGDLARWRSDGTIEFLGRVDQQIKVRGFRIEPGEIEAAIASHPGVRQAVVVAREDVPGDKRLVAYVVCTDAAQPSIRAELEDLLQSRLPRYLVPEAIVLLDRLPLTNNGKVDRAVLPAPMTGKQYARRHVAPRNETERKIAALFAKLLRLPSVSVVDDYFELGGNSLGAVHLSAVVEQEFHCVIPLQAVFDGPTVEQLAVAIETLRRGTTDLQVVPLRASGNEAPLFFIPGAGGHASSLRDLAMRLGDNQPVYGLQPRGMDGQAEPDGSIQEMAAHFVQAMTRMDPVGPYYLAGFSAGGIVAWEMARQLADTGRKVAFLALLDTYGPGYPRLAPLPIRVMMHLKTAFQQGPAGAFVYVQKRVAYRLRHVPWIGRDATVPLPETNGTMAAAIRKVTLAWMDAVVRYELRPANQHVVLFRAQQDPKKVGAAYDDLQMGWGKLALAGIEVRQVPGSHSLIVQPPYVDELAAELQAALQLARQAVRA